MGEGWKGWVEGEELDTTAAVIPLFLTRQDPKEPAGWRRDNQWMSFFYYYYYSDYFYYHYSAPLHYKCMHVLMHSSWGTVQGRSGGEHCFRCTPKQQEAQVYMQIAVHTDEVK